MGSRPDGRLAVRRLLGGGGELPGAVGNVFGFGDELLDSSEQRGPDADDNQFRPAVRAVIQDLLADAANLAAIAEQRAWDGDISSEEFALAMRADAWADQVKALAASFLQELGEEPPRAEGPAL